LTETALLADQTLEQIRELSLSLRPSLLDDLGLVPTLRWYLERVSGRLNIEIAFQAQGLQTRLSGDIETTLYRVVQEALTNIAKHADARTVSVRIDCVDNSVVATIEDDGRGFDPRRLERAAHPFGAGLLGMKERVTFMGGQFDVRSRRGKGTKLSIAIPIEKDNALRKDVT
jgi:signal transduction histidine kinase